MKKTLKHTLPAALVLCMALSLLCPSALAIGSVTINEQYLYAGCNMEWYTEEAYWSSPVVVDLDGDGSLEVLTAAYSLSVMDAATGTTKWEVNSGHDRSTPYNNAGGNDAGQVYTDIEVLDIDADGQKEIIIGYNNGTVSVLNNQGYFKPGWPQKPTYGGIRSIAVADLDRDGKQEIVVGAGIADPVSVWVYRCDGTVASGWPQLESSKNGAYVTDKITETAWSYGVFADGITFGDMDNDGQLEIIVPTDNASINVYNYDGSLVKTGEAFGNRAWGKIALFEDYNMELSCENEGWGHSITGNETRSQLYRGEFGFAAVTYTDLDGDGTEEIVTTALIIDRTALARDGGNGIPQVSDSKYMTVAIFNKDRTRYTNSAKGFDWTALPTELNSSISGPLRKTDGSSSMTADVCPEPVCADLDGDGNKEILFNSYDGKLHCFSLNKSEWNFTMPKTTSSVYEYATAPVCMDLDGDGKQEVIFASWTDIESRSNFGQSGVNGAIYVLSHDGKVLATRDLCDGYSNYEGTITLTNGVLGTPVVQDIDSDGKYEILLNTTYHGLCVYELEVAGGGTTPPPSVPTNTAYCREQTINIDGSPVTLNSYALKDANGNETNYVRARDIAYLLNGTAAQFNVGWDGNVNLNSHTPYVADGNEMKAPFNGLDKTYTVPDSVTNVDGRVAALDAILLKDDNGGGYTYYKLRDLGAALGFTVDWDGMIQVYTK